MEVDVLASPRRHGVVGTGTIVPGEPRSGTFVVRLPRELAGEEPAAGPQQARDRGEHRVELHVVERHHGADGVEPADRVDVFDTSLNQARVRRRLGVDADGVETPRRQALDEPTVAAADVEHSGARSDGVRDDLVEAAPPAIVANRHDQASLRISR